MDFNHGTQLRNGSNSRSVVEQAASLAKLMLPKRTKNELLGLRGGLHVGSSGLSNLTCSL